MRKLLGYPLLAAGVWMTVAPQALMGLPELKWMANHAFPGEVLLGIVATCLAYWLLDFQPKPGGDRKPNHH